MKIYIKKAEKILLQSTPAGWAKNTRSGAFLFFHSSKTDAQ